MMNIFGTRKLQIKIDGFLFSGDVVNTYTTQYVIPCCILLRSQIEFSEHEFITFLDRIN